MEEVPSEPDSSLHPHLIPGYESDDLGDAVSDAASDAGSDWSLGEGNTGYLGDPLTEADRMYAWPCMPVPDLVWPGFRRGGVSSAACLAQ